MCGPTDKCCCCIPLSTGIKLLSVLLILELLSQCGAAASRPYENGAVSGVDGLTILCTLATVVCSFWSVCSPQNLSARKWFLAAVWINFIVGTLGGLAALAGAEEGARSKCMSIAKAGNHIVVEWDQTWLPVWSFTEFRMIQPPYKTTYACIGAKSGKMRGMIAPLLLYDILIQIFVIVSVTHWKNAPISVNENAIYGNGGNFASV